MSGSFSPAAFVAFSPVIGRSTITLIEREAQAARDYWLRVHHAAA